MNRRRRQQLDSAAAYRALRKLASLPLADKIKRARRLLRAAADTGRPVVAFSGGRDSVALAILARETIPAAPLVYVATGLADPRLTAFVRDWGGDGLVYLENQDDPEKNWAARGCFPIGAKVSDRSYRRDNPELKVNPRLCCQLHKAAPMDAWLRDYGCTCLTTGARGDDSNRHKFKLTAGEVIQDHSKGFALAYPLLTWKQTDTLDYLAQRLPDYPLMYGRGEEYGCRACAVNLARWPNQLARLRQADPRYHRHLITRAGFGAQILMIRYGLTADGARALAKRDGWKSLIASGAFDRIPYPRAGRR